MHSSATACTYCSAGKRPDPGLLPAIERYQSVRIAELQAAGALLILSGEFGLLAPEDPIPFYDHLLLIDEVEAMVPQVSAQLQDRGVASLVFHTADPDSTPEIRPYVALITRACQAAQVALKIKLLEGNPA